MIELIEYSVSGGFWRFVGVMMMVYLLLYFPTNLILQIIHKIIRRGTISKHGYPPPHCDGDGDFKGED